MLSILILDLYLTNVTMLYLNNPNQIVAGMTPLSAVASSFSCHLLVNLAWFCIKLPFAVLGRLRRSLASLKLTTQSTLRSMAMELAFLPLIPLATLYYH